MLWLLGRTCYVVLNSERHCNAERFGAGQNRLSAAIIAFSNRYARVGFVTQNGSDWASETDWVVTAAIGCLAVGMADAGVPRTPGLETFAIAETVVSAGAQHGKESNNDRGGDFRRDGDFYSFKVR